MPRRHELKCWPGPFQATVESQKRFEWRRDDRGFEPDDELLLREWVPEGNEWAPTGRATGAWCLVRVLYVLRGRFGVPDGYCVMSILVIGHGDTGSPPPPRR